MHKTNDQKLIVKLNTAVSSCDAHAVDIKYHKRCWLKNVSNMLRKSSEDLQCVEDTNKIAAKIEFVTMTKKALERGDVLNVTLLHKAYEDILCSNNVVSPSVHRKMIKSILQDEIPGIEFHKPSRANESERVTIKKTRDAAVNVQQGNSNDDMKKLYDAATILRKSITNSEVWNFTGSLQDMTDKHLPKELYSFFRWVLQGPNSVISEGEKDLEVHRRATSLSQTTVSMYLSDRQSKNKKSEMLNSVRDMPQQLAVGLTVHQEARSKKLVNMLSAFGMSCEYNKLMRIETQIESAVLNRMEYNGGVYLPPDIVKGRHLFFAVDNIDFSEDTPDGKRNLHGTAMTIYQKCNPSDQKPDLLLDDNATTSRSIHDLPTSLTELLDCPEPPSKPTSTIFPNFTLQSVDQSTTSLSLPDTTWLLGRTIERSLMQPIEENSATPTTLLNIPTWSGYNSLVNRVNPVTRIGAPPLLASPAHEWQTLLTILKQAQNIKTAVVGSSKKTVISLDMALYQPAKQLHMSRDDLKHIILRPGELHIVMAELRTIGSYIEDSGIDLSWIEADLYGPATVKQILEGNHVNRAETAHLLTLQALFSLYQEAFLKEHPDLKTHLVKASEKLNKACTYGKKTRCKECSPGIG